jgi:hypothetical protein
MEAIEAGKTIDKIFVQGGLQGEIYSDLKKLLKKYNIRPNTVPVEKLNRFTRKIIKVLWHLFRKFRFIKLRICCHRFLRKEKFRFY